MTSAVETRDLTKRFGAFTAVDSLTISIEEGEVFGFLGSNGAGKSTAIRILCGLLSPTSGSATVLGVDVAKHPDVVKRQIGYMSQRFSLYEDLTVRQNLRFFGGVYGLHGAELAEREAWAIDMADLAGKEEALTGSLPGGWKQRLALACAVLHRPKVLFLDEPTGGVDPISRRRFWSRIDEMAAAGVTILVTTHYLDEAERCDRMALMHAGRLAARGGVAELRDVFRGQSLLEVSCPRLLEALERLEAESWVLEASVFGTKIHAVVVAAAAAAAAAAADGGGRRRILDILERDGNVPASAEEIVPSLEDVFIHHIEAEEARLRHAGARRQDDTAGGGGRA